MGRIAYSLPMSDTVRRELLATRPGRPIHVSHLGSALCGASAIGVNRENDPRAPHHPTSEEAADNVRRGSRICRRCQWAVQQMDDAVRELPVV